jgi:hypothetical protein
MEKSSGEFSHCSQFQFFGFNQNPDLLDVLQELLLAGLGGRFFQKVAFSRFEFQRSCPHELPQKAVLPNKDLFQGL